MSKARDLANLGANASGLTTDAELAAAIVDFATDSEVSSAVSSKIGGNGSITQIVEVTQAQYNALTPNATTLYVIVG